MRLLIFPAILFSLSSLIFWSFGDGLVLPDEFDEVVVWLRAQGEYAWAVGAGVILADAVLPAPSTLTTFALGIIYGPLLGGAIGGGAAVLAGLTGFGATRLLGRRGALWLVGEKDLARTQAFYERWGLYAVVFGRAIGGPAEWAVILAGLSNLRFLPVLGALCLGGFGSGFVMAALGAMAVTHPLAALAISVGLLAVMLLVAQGLKRPARKNPAEPLLPAADVETRSLQVTEARSPVRVSRGTRDARALDAPPTIG